MKMQKKTETKTETDVKKNNFRDIKKLMTKLEKKERERATIQAKLKQLGRDIPAIKKELFDALNEEETEVKNIETTTNNFMS